jgi:iron(III) transport system permease protein
VLRGSHEKTVLQDKKELLVALARSAPGEGADDGAVDTWLDEATKSYPGLHLLYVRGIPGVDETTTFARDDALKTLWQARQADPDDKDFAKGIEAASYLETYFVAEPVRLGASDSLLVFAPVANPEGDTAIGLVLAGIDENILSGFNNLTYALSLIAFFVFALGFGIATFSRDPPTGYAILVLFAIVLLFVAYPLFEALRLTFVQDGRFTFAVWREILTNRQYLSALYGSIQLGVLTATLSTIVGFVFAFFVSRTSVGGKKLITALATLPVISPPFSLTLSIILLFGNNGLITKGLLGLENFSIYGLGGLGLVQTISMFPIAFLTLTGVLDAIDSTLEDASLDLNASRWQTFSRVTLPLAMPGILSSWLLVFTNSLADFANPLLLSGSFRVLSVESYIEVTGMNRLGNGAALSILLLLPTLTAFFVQRAWVAKKSFVVVTGKPSGRLSDLASKPTRNVLLALVATTSAFIVALYGTIVAGCFVKNWGIDYTFTTANIVEALERGQHAMISTMTLAGIATPIAGFIAMVGAVLVVRKSFPGKRLLEALMMTPFAVPGTLIGISYILAFNEPPFLLVGTGAILVICYVIRELPVGLEGGVATLRQIDPAIEEAASDLGADQATVFRTVILPLIRPAFISSMSYTFVRSMTAVSAIVFLISAKWYHITIQIYNFSENIRFGLASVLATALIFIVLAAFGLMRLLVRKSEHLEKTVTVQ